jgi:hypothetical protein
VWVDSPVELRLEPASQRFDATDDRWLDQVASLIVDLRENVGEVDVRRDAVPGAKGALEAIVLPLASAGALTGAVEVLKAWLGRDRSRSVKVTWSGEGELQQLEMSGTKVDDEAFDEVVRSVVAQLAAPP